MKVEVNIKKVHFYVIVVMLVLLIGFVGVNAYRMDGGGNPAIFGHSSGEIEETDPTVLASVKDGISWNELTGIPAGFVDRVDNDTRLAISLSNLPSGSIAGLCTISSFVCVNNAIPPATCNSPYGCQCLSGWTPFVIDNLALDEYNSRTVYTCVKN